MTCDTEDASLDVCPNFVVGVTRPCDHGRCVKCIEEVMTFPVSELVGGFSLSRFLARFH